MLCLMVLSSVTLRCDLWHAGRRKLTVMYVRLTDRRYQGGYNEREDGTEFVAMKFSLFLYRWVVNEISKTASLISRGKKFLEASSMI